MLFKFIQFVDIALLTELQQCNGIYFASYFLTYDNQIILLLE